MKSERINYLKDNYMSSDRFGVIVEKEIPFVASELNVTETTLKKDLKELGCVIYKRKPPRVKDLEPYIPILEGLKLKLKRRMPEYVQKKSVRSLIGSTLWGKVRGVVLQKYDNRCCACGYTSNDLTTLHVHEEWEFDEDDLTIKLIGLSLLCHMCHSLHHYDHTYYRSAEKDNWEEVRQKLDIHFMRVNECSQEILIASKNLASKQQMLLYKMPNAESVESLHEFFEKTKRLQSAKWTYSVFNEMPFREEVIKALEKKVKIAKIAGSTTG